MPFVTGLIKAIAKIVFYKERISVTLEKGIENDEENTSVDIVVQNDRNGGEEFAYIKPFEGKNALQSVVPEHKTYKKNERKRQRKSL